MKKKLLLTSSIVALVFGGTTAIAATSSIPAEIADSLFAATTGTEESEGDKYDHWCNSWSKPGHVYFHYNRGANKTDYNEFCLWLWDDSTDTDGTLWAYDGPTAINTIVLNPMSTHWMYNSEVGLEGDTVYKDEYGVICDVDLTKQLINGKRKNTASDTPASYDNCTDLGFLFPKKSTMDGRSHWTSDGGKDMDIDDWKEPENWRAITGGTCEHIFLASGQLQNWSYYAGSGIPEVKINPMDKDTTGSYSSKVVNIPDTYGVSKTSKSFKELGVGYQIFVPSFRDSNGDGKGDIRGIIDSLDYFKELGVDVLWLTPIQKSDSYHGYDISDYYAVDPKFGTLDDYRELLFKAHQNGMKVLMDLVLNHTSKNNVWFTKSQWAVNSNAPGAEKDSTGINWRNVYTWKYATDKVWQAKRNAQGTGIATPVQYEKVAVSQNAADPNGPSWYRDGESNYYYYGKFGSGMPEINYENPDTRKLVIDMAKYWLSFGLDGFRLDAVKHIYMKDEVDDTGSDIIIQDVGSKHAFDEEKGQYIDQPFDYSSDLTKNVAWWKHFSNEIKKIYPECFLVGENFDGYGTRTAPYYQGLDSQFDFANYYHVPGWLYNAGGASNYINEPTETFDPFRSNSNQTISNPDGSTSSIPGGKRSDFIDGAFTSNHDVMRAINQANGSGTKDDSPAKVTVTGTAQEVGRAKVHAATTVLHPGISWIYYGDELGMSSNTEKHIELYDNENSTDIWYRQPMMWTDETIRPDYQVGAYQFRAEAYDSYNKTLFNAGKGVSLANGKVTTTNDMYAFYKKLCELKAMYPDNAQCNFANSTANVLIMNIWGENKPPLKIYIHTGFNDDGYILNPDDSFKATPVMQIGTSATKGSNFGDWYSVVAFQGK